MNLKAMRYVLPLLILMAMIVTGCAVDAPDAADPTSGTGAAVTAPEDTGTEPVYTEPEAPAMTFPAEIVTVPSEAPAQETETETVAGEEDPTEEATQEEVPMESYAAGENELPAVPF